MSVHIIPSCEVRWISLQGIVCGGRLLHRLQLCSLFVNGIESVWYYTKNVCAAQRRQCQELLSMLNVKEQRVYQGTKPQYSPDSDTGVLEVSGRHVSSVVYWFCTGHWWVSNP